ncbi:hypothetical protein KPH14_001751 [Odynerus spinipes]|uniref:Methyltransferase NSUN7 n=1 Tax=Odynerus spinipes TaxID=1348599 RepID=A0AAD9VX81_9HYME|nr:hypothetical protein KPH14_001751 [Odynerus spinipes]
MIETRTKGERGLKLKDPQECEWTSGKLERIVKAKLLKKGESSSLLATLSSDGSMTEACFEPGWRVEDILLAAKVLEKGQIQPCYANEAEMRRVFGLVYDVLRYRNVLNYVLQDVGFWSRNHNLKGREKIVWLLLYDMQGRKFSRRGDVVAIETRNRIFQTVGLKDIEDALLEVKTHLAASVSRLRIAGSALTLDKLLPKHLRTSEGIVWTEESSIASGWINTANTKITKPELMNELSTKLELNLCENCEVTELDENTYAFDPFCPKVINLHERARERVACSDLVREHQFIFLERSLCLGAAAITRAMRIGRLCGPVVLTHSVAPRHTGYLAELLSGIDGAGRLLAFGTGDRRYEYEAYLKKLGITLQQCRVFSEKYISPPPSVELDRATVVLATPPSSYIGVKDIVDLVVARDGDTKLLESLTDTNDEISQSRAVLTEQLATLKYALTRPNVQFLIYEVHSVLPTETTKMVEQVVEYANQMATEKYIRENMQKKKSASKEKQGQLSGTKVSVKNILRTKSRSNDERVENIATDSPQGDDNGNQREEDETPSSAYRNINVPKSDLFEILNFNDIYGENSARTLEPGCFLSIIKRKEMMQFDSLFMIKVAEAKGLFGDTNKEEEKKESKPIAIPTPVTVPTYTDHAKRKIDIDRLMIPTCSSMLRYGIKSRCSRFLRHFALYESHFSSRARLIRKQDLRRCLPKSESLRKLRQPTEIMRKDSDELKYRIQKIKKKQILSSVYARAVPQKYQPVSSRLFLPNNNKIKTSQEAVSTKQEKSNPLDILEISTMNFWNQQKKSPREDPDTVSLKKQQNKEKESNCFSSSTVLRKSALIRATQRQSFVEVLSEHDKKIRHPFRGLEHQPINNMSFGRVSKRHRANPMRNKWQVPFRSRLETLVEHTPGFPYLFPNHEDDDDIANELNEY